jgi:hypothetical protein
LSATAHASSFPPYDHVFLIVEENTSASALIGNPAAPELNALAATTAWLRTTPPPRVQIGQFCTALAAEG